LNDSEFHHSSHRLTPSFAEATARQADFHRFRPGSALPALSDSRTGASRAGRGALAATDFILNNSEFNVGLMSNCISPGALLLMVIVNYQAGVNYSRYPAEQSQKKTKKETTKPSGHQHRQRWENNAKKIAQRFHRFLLTSDF
jgi:hypothetical protein